LAADELYITSMTVRADKQILDEMLDPVSDCLTPDVAARISALRATPKTQARLDTLARKNSRGALTPAQDAEYDAYVEAFDVVAILQAKARKALKTARHAN